MPDQASTLAAEVDELYFFYLVVCGFAGLLVFLLTAVFAIRYRKKAGRYRQGQPNALILEIVWTAIPLMVVMILFVWGAKLYVRAYSPPKRAMEIFVTGKQWMWKIQHPSGRREINALHVPIGQEIKLTMTSEDVIHSFYVPAFRLKKDVLPGRYTSMWFKPIKEGTFHLFCAEYCGTDHSRMIGEVVVMTPANYQRWLTGDDQVESLASKGQKLFIQRGCKSCHSAESRARGPDLQGLFGRTRLLKSGRQRKADEAYIRESILTPGRELLVGYAALMPTFKGQISEEGVIQLIAYIKSISENEGAPSLEGVQP